MGCATCGHSYEICCSTEDTISLPSGYNWRQSCLPQVNPLDSTIGIVHVDMGGVISLAIAMVGSIHLYLCTATHRRSGIPVKVFLVGLRPDSHTDILDLTPLRSLVYFDCEGPRGRIDILDLSLSLSLGLAEFYIGRCRRDTNPSSVRLDVVEMDMVASCRIFMVCCFDRDFITTV